MDSKYQRVNHKNKFQKEKYNDEYYYKLIEKWWLAVINKDLKSIDNLMSPSLQIVNVSNRISGRKNILKHIKDYKIIAGFQLHSFKLTKDSENTIVSYLVDHLLDTDTNYEQENSVLHSVVFNCKTEIISWNNFSY